MKLSSDLIDGLRDAKQSEFEQRVVEHLKDAYIEVTFELEDDEILRRVQAAIDRAVAHGLRSERDVVTYVDLSFDQGDGFEEREPWARRVFDDPGLTPQERIHRLRQHVFGID